MATKLEAESRNGTLSINQQTDSQRVKFGQRFRSGLGVGVDRVGAGSLFPESPINNITKREGVTADGQAIVGGNVYSMFATAIDDSEDLSVGFGFGTDIDDVSLNYQHTDNPFLDGNYTNLTTGEASDDDGLKKRFMGYPALVPSDIHTATTAIQGDVANEGLARGTADEPFVDKNFGSETSADRQKNSESSSLGFFATSGEGNLTDNDEPETLGTYFSDVGSDDGQQP